MAKLQGHFLKYKNNVPGAIANAKSLLDVEYQIKDMSINEWLRRLNFHKFAHKFKKDGIRRVVDLKHLQEGELTGYGLIALTDRKRVMNMINGEESAKANFALQTRAAARTVISQFMTESKDIEEILDLVGEEKITGFQILDVFDENKNFNEIKRKLDHKIVSNEAILKGLRKEEDDEEK